MANMRGILKAFGTAGGVSLSIVTACSYDDPASSENDAALQDAEKTRVLHVQSAEPPSGLVSVGVGSDALSIWPYTGETFETTPSDPVNLIFVGNVTPLAIRDALLGLSGNRPGFPPAPPFNSPWTDAIGGVQTTYSDEGGWRGSVIQLEAGTYGPLRFHLRLWETAAEFPGGGRWVLANAHVDLLIPGTAEHQVIAWKFARQLVVADFIRSGLLAAPPAPTDVVNATPSFRTIPAPIFNGIPESLKPPLELPAGPSMTPVPIPNDGRALILNVSGSAAPAGGDDEALTIQFNQIIPRPFCMQGATDFVRVQGPVELSRVARVVGGRYEYKSVIDGVLTVTPVPAGPSFQARISDMQSGWTSGDQSFVRAASQRIAPQDGGSELLIKHLIAASNGADSYHSNVKCIE